MPVQCMLSFKLFQRESFKNYLCSPIWAWVLDSLELDNVTVVENQWHPTSVSQVQVDSLRTISPRSQYLREPDKVRPPFRVLSFKGTLCLRTLLQIQVTVAISNSRGTYSISNEQHRGKGDNSWLGWAHDKNSLGPGHSLANSVLQQSSIMQRSAKLVLLWVHTTFIFLQSFI